MFAWFYKLKMMNKLLVGFGLVALGLPALGYIGLSNMKKLSANSTSLYELDVLGLSYIMDMQSKTRALSRSVSSAISSEDRADVEVHAKAVAKTDQELQKVTAQIKGTMVYDEEKSKLAEVESHYGKMMQMYNESVQLALLNKDAEAKEAASKTRPLRDRSDQLVDELIKAKLKASELSRKDSERVYTESRNFMVGIILGSMMIAFTLGYFIAGQVASRLREAVTTMDRAAHGDLTVRMPVTSGDEFGALGTSLNGFLDTLEYSLRSIGDNAQSLAGSAEELAAVSQQMSSNAEESSAQAGVLSAASEQVSNNVQTAATSTEEMSASIREIAKNAVEAAKVARGAVQVAESTNTTVSRLGDSSAEIGQVIKVINSIAEQTNLLALNATIEAARAGEAGKGFAVVANEVKELAKQTGKATEDISQKIQSIQGSTQEAVQAIQSIGNVINQINDISNTIASAVEEQSVTTNEITRNVGEAAKGVAEIARNVGGVAEAAKSTSSGASNTETAAGDLSRMAEELKSLVAQFKYDGAATETERAMRRIKPAHTPAATVTRQAPAGAVQEL